MDFYYFYSGKEFEAYNYLGAHVQPGGGVTFRTYAPNAEKVYLTGECNQWGQTEMTPVYDGKFWEVYLPKAKAKQMYKYQILTQDKKLVDHCDPYAFFNEKR